MPDVIWSALQICMEFGTTKRLSQSAAAAVQFGVEPEDALAKVEKLTARLATMEEVSHEQYTFLYYRIISSSTIEDSFL